MTARLRAPALGIGLLDFFNLVAAEGLDGLRLVGAVGLTGPIGLVLRKLGGVRREERLLGRAQRDRLRLPGRLFPGTGRRGGPASPLAEPIGVPLGRCSGGCDGAHARIALLHRFGMVRGLRRGL